jgi:hypothetical protein
MVICACALAFCLAAALYYRTFEFLPFALGVALTSGLCALKVIMLARAVQLCSIMDDAKKASNHIRMQYLLRFALTAIVLWLCAILPFISFFGAVAGVFTFKIASYSNIRIINR